jgi:hypothetical protein
MGAGAVVAAAAAAKRKARECILDGFRLAGATAPERARSLAELGLTQGNEMEELMRAGVICAGTQGSTWFLNEAAVIALRDSRPRTILRVLLAVVVALLAILVGALAYRTGR